MRLLKKWNTLTARIVAFYQQGWYAIAEKLAKETLEFAEKAFGPDHPNVAESLNNLALICYSQAKEAEAAIFEHTLSQRQGDVLWPESPAAAEYLNKLVLLNLSKRKYSQAESFFERALAIKKYGLGQEHAELSQILGNLADLHKSQGNYDEAEFFIKSLRIQGNPGLQSDNLSDGQANVREIKEIKHNREYMRCTGHFPAKLSRGQKDSSIEGITENISQVGTFIKTKDWKTFKPDDQVSVAISLPSVFSEQYAAVEMVGPGIITRVDEENEGVGIQFIRSFKQFKRVGETEVAGKIRYKKLVHYLTLLDEMSLADFSEVYPRGFFVERLRLDFDHEVIFQFSTNEIDVPEAQNKLPDGLMIKDFLEARVIEINKKKIDVDEGVVTIGRAASNDIVLYNKTISKSQAFLYFPLSEAGAYVVDLKSTNCTFLNDTKIAPYVTYNLSDGDEISFGPQTKVIYLTTGTFYDFVLSLKRSSQSRMDS
jgi:tetratricopeptide (TPR) repeat protein